jgi:hypothetical protein
VGCVSQTSLPTIAINNPHSFALLNHFCTSGSYGAYGIMLLWLARRGLKWIIQIMADNILLG